MDSLPGLDQLNDIVIPAAPPFWPIAGGAWAVLLIGLYLLAIAVLYRRKKQQDNAYRTVGLSMLKKATTVYDVSILLKRVALATFPREQVASLYGEKWFEFLQATSKKKDYAIVLNADPQAQASKQQKALAAYWIKHHRANTDKHEAGQLQ